jgi:hypothetical protein
MATLIVESGPDAGRTYQVGDSTVLGRLGTNEVQIADAQASRTHTKIVKEPDGYHAIDLGSRNGTIVNSIKAQNVLLKNGDRITIGKVVLRFEDGTQWVAGSPPQAVAGQTPAGVVDTAEPSSPPIAPVAPVPGKAAGPPSKQKQATSPATAVSERRQRTIRSAGSEGQGVVALQGWKKWVVLALCLAFFVGLFFAAKWIGQKAFSKLVPSAPEGERREKK